jgi:hypothetical protein
VPADEPLVVAGDFNDWGEKLDGRCASSACTAPSPPMAGRAQRLTFPSLAPVFALDRFYLRGLAAARPWCRAAPPGPACPTTCRWWRSWSRREMNSAPAGPARQRRSAAAPPRPGPRLRNLLEWAVAACRGAVSSAATRCELLQGGDELFPAMHRAIDGGRGARSGWPPTSSTTTPAGRGMAEALCAAARRGVQVHVVVDGFGSMATLPRCAQWWPASGVQLEVFRPLDRWYAWLQPNQLRRLHQKLCVVDEAWPSSAASTSSTTATT